MNKNGKYWRFVVQDKAIEDTIHQRCWWGDTFINIWAQYLPQLMVLLRWNSYAPINVKPKSGGKGGVRTRSGDLTNFHSPWVGHLTNFSFPGRVLFDRCQARRWAIWFEPGDEKNIPRSLGWVYILSFTHVDTSCAILTMSWSLDLIIW